MRIERESEPPNPPETSGERLSQSRPVPDRPEAAARVRNFSFAVVAGQAGCWSLVIIIAALLIGIFLDGQFGLRGPFTIGLLLFSIPFSLFAMVRIALSSVKRITPMQPPTPTVTKRRQANVQTEED